jgi:pSer/pThr/pTyr-binding forkhead associated (FHA) protein
MGTLMFLMLLAGFAGLVAWAIAEPSRPPLGSSDVARWEAMFAFVVGACIGGAVGGFAGWLQGSRTHFWRGILLGILLGGLGGTIGLSLGGTIAFAIFGNDIFQAREGVAMNPLAVPARMLVFIPFGGFVGAVHALGSRSPRRALQGLIGGVIGGAVGGAVFDVVGSLVGNTILQARGQVVGEVGILSRAIACVAMGAAIGLFVGIVEILGRKAWLRLELGRNEGKEWIIDAPRSFIGRSENADVPLFGDPLIQPMHACIERHRGVYRLVDAGSPIGVGVNGVRVPQADLNPGDIVNIGSYSLRFLMRGSAVPRPADARRPPVAVGLPQKPPSPPAAPTFELVAIDGPMAGQRFAVNNSELVAGREGNINLGFDPGASRRHASFSRTGAGVFVRDLGSTNGTMVNGVRVQEMALRLGDTVRIGGTTFRLE